MQELKGVREQGTIPTHTTHSLKKDKKEAKDQGFKKGNEVIITNGYCGVMGTKGTITHIMKTHVTFLDKSGKTHTEESSPNMNKTKLSSQCSHRQTSSNRQSVQEQERIQ